MNADIAMDMRQMNVALAYKRDGTELDVRFITPDELVGHVQRFIFSYDVPSWIAGLRVQCAVCGQMSERFYRVRWAKVCPLCVEKARATEGR